MKNRWIGGLALATALMLGACAPTQLGDDATSEPTEAAESAAPAATTEATESAEASESAAPTPDDYEY